MTFKHGHVVRCVRAWKGNLTKNKDYKVVAVSRGLLQVKNDQGRVQGYSFNRFQRVYLNGNLGPYPKLRVAPTVVVRRLVPVNTDSYGFWEPDKRKEWEK